MIKLSKSEVSGMILEYIVEEDSIVLKDYLAKIRLPRNFRSGQNKEHLFFFVNNQEVANYYRLKKGDKLVIVASEKDKDTTVNPVKDNLTILFEDEYFLIVEKRPGLATIPTRKHYNQSLANHIMAYYREKGIVARIHFVTRLDLPTSGIVILAKNGYLHALMENVPLVKKYLLMAEGTLEQSEGEIVLPIAKDENSTIKREVDPAGQLAKTKYRVLAREENRSLVEAELLTGRTHQIRVHFSHLGHPIVGDKLYGKESETGLMLHSYFVEFVHLITKERISVRSYPHWWKSRYPQA
ncbi:MAG TPA: RluA family pseudouridine synthase [Bacilli bacterium]|jgi:23S rRNA pseudouridine1911/1915/1917 synthase|nr:RluA family pseudouridine synthase [Acholeplasmataceae bacterium]HOR95282.1 RluA family pseudouridine synthase [Bacilli bacterium]HPK58074.1 RluA family pseudouridine synthase [Bacilli bacterium]